jgi:hypothetical protein
MKIIGYILFIFGIVVVLGWIVHPDGTPEGYTALIIALCVGLGGRHLIIKARKQTTE